MGYSSIDLIDKAISIAIRRKAIYEKVGTEITNIPTINIMVKVLIKEVDKSIQYYEELKNQIGDVEFEEIDFGIYDKISFLISEFNNRYYVGEVKNPRDFFKFSINLEKDIYSLLIDIQGRLVKNANDVYTKTYKSLSGIIENKAKHIEALEKMLK